MSLPTPRPDSPPFENFDDDEWQDEQEANDDAEESKFPDTPLPSDWRSTLAALARVDIRIEEAKALRAIVHPAQIAPVSLPTYADGPHAAHLQALEKSIKKSNGSAVAYFMFELLEVHQVDPERICHVFYEVFKYLAPDDLWPIVFEAVLETKVTVRMASRPLDFLTKGLLCSLAAQLTHAEKMRWTHVEDVAGNLIRVDPRNNKPNGTLDLFLQCDDERDFFDLYPFIMEVIKEEKMRYLPRSND